MDKVQIEHLMALLPTPTDETDYSEFIGALNDITDGFESKVSEYATKVADRDSEITRLKGVNFDLMINGSKTESKNDSENDGGSEELPTIESLFTYK